MPASKPRATALTRGSPPGSNGRESSPARLPRSYTRSISPRASSPSVPSSIPKSSDCTRTLTSRWMASPGPPTCAPKQRSWSAVPVAGRGPGRLPNAPRPTGNHRKLGRARRFAPRSPQFADSSPQGCFAGIASCLVPQGRQRRKVLDVISQDGSSLFSPSRKSRISARSFVSSGQALIALFPKTLVNEI